MINILFLCHGNICRSPMAEFVMKEYVRQAGLDHEVLVESAALHRDEIGSDIHWGTEEILDRYHIPHTPRQAHLAIKADYKNLITLLAWIATTCAICCVFSITILRRNAL